jgi:hypothetical protein
LETLRRLDVLPGEDSMPSPNVAAVEGRITSENAWADLEENDVVVVTPHSASPEIEGIVAPPPDFFDVVIVDEGHHTPARTWAAFIKQIPKAKHILCSATPFRKDRLQLPGRMIFNYPLRAAVEEKAFGKVSYVAVPIPPNSGREEKDQALVEKVVATYRRDNEQFEHRLLVRTDSIKDAERLAGLYVEAGLTVETVSSRLSKKTFREIEERLRGGALDGVVCVDMFGEGYDFPKFKIAALHAPHRSLVPTLQFIGRFARTNDERTGDATFLAVPDDVNAESNELYSEGVDWDVLLADVADASQQLSIRQRETLRSFKETGRPSADYEMVEIGHFRLPQHVAAYQATQPPVNQDDLEAIHNLQIACAWKSEDESTHLFLTNDTKPPVWSRGDCIIDSRHDCFLLKYYPSSGIAFIAATQRNNRYYSELIELFFQGNASPLPFNKVRKVLNGLQGQEFFNVGMRNTSPTATTETYRIVAGSQADRGVRDSDAGHYCTGHFFGRGDVDGEKIIVGASAGGKVWSTGKTPLPELIDWMDSLHTRITSDTDNIGKSGLDKLAVGVDLTAIPANAVAADWPSEGYKKNPTVVWSIEGVNKRTPLLDLDIRDIVVARDGRSMAFTIADDTSSKRYLYRLTQIPAICSEDGAANVQVESRDGDREALEEWLCEHAPTFYTSSLDTFCAGTLHTHSAANPFNIQSAIAFDWTGCDIEVEVGAAAPGRRTVQAHLQAHLETLPSLEFILFDHRSGEAADFVVGQTAADGGLRITLIHCKGAGGNPSGARVKDVYEIACQSVKSVRFQKKDTLLGHIDRRTDPRKTGGISSFIVGERDSVLETIKRRDPIGISWRVVAVQPGLDSNNLSETVMSVMAAANDSVAAQQSTLEWWTS